MSEKMDRRKFLHLAGAGAAAAAIVSPVMNVMAQGTKKMTATAAAKPGAKKRLALVGTGSRGTELWGRILVERYPDITEFIGLMDTNPGRLEAAKKLMGVECPVYTDFEKMVRETKPDYVMVTTVDSTHDDYIVRALELGCDVITEKPMTIDEVKCQRILDAERRTGRKVIVTFNYRYSPHRAKLWSLLREGRIGEITSFDFNWYLDTQHGADYFRRWHRKREFGGSLWLHKATHHFDLLNWWIDSDPLEVFALGALEFYGKNGKFRGENCRSCPHAKQCDFYWDITKNKKYVALYTDNEKFDGYLRDGCVFKNDIDIFDKMGATIKYANGVQGTYSLTTYSPYEGYRIAFNGTKGRIDLWCQEKNPTFEADYEEIMITNNFGSREYVRVIDGKGGHAGGDHRMTDMIFRNTPDPMRQAASVRDGAMSILVGIAARKSCDSGAPVKIASLTDLVPQAKKM